MFCKFINLKFFKYTKTYIQFIYSNRDVNIAIALCTAVNYYIVQLLYRHCD
jgi:hypothetical protein